MSNATDKGYWIRGVPQTPDQVAVQYGTDKIASIVKSCLKDYIASFLDSDGKNRNFIASAFPSLDIYLSDGVKSNITKEDPTKRSISLTQLYERVKETMPCILLDDGAVTYKSPGIGTCTGTSLIGEKTQFWLKTVRDVSTTIILGANDFNTCSMLRDSISVMFGDIAKFICGDVLLKAKDDSSSWEIVLNITPMDIGTLEKVAAGTGESANNLVYFCQNIVTCRFESCFAMEMPATKHSFVDKDYTMSIDAPDTIEVGTSATITINNIRPLGIRVQTTDANILRLKQTSPTTLQAMALKEGTAKIQLINENIHSQKKFDNKPKIVLEKEITTTI